MSTPITDDERARIIELIQSGKSRSEVAKTSGRGKSTITRIANDIGWDWLEAADERTQSSLARAHESRSAYAAERRAALAEKLTDEADRLLDEMRKPWIAWSFGGKDNTFAFKALPEPDTKAKRDLMASARDAVRTILDIDRHDNQANDGMSAVDDWLRGLIGDAAEGDAA